MAPKSSRTKRSKAEVEQEFAQLAEMTTEEKNASSAKQEMASQMHEKEIRAAVS